VATAPTRTVSSALATALSVVVIGLPLWSAGKLDAGTEETMKVCLMGVALVPLVLPGGYVFRHDMKAPGARWKGQAGAQGPGKLDR
jgi:hypothetical protein